MPPAPVVGVEPRFEDSLKKPEKVIPRKPDHLSYKYFYNSKKEVLSLIYTIDPRLASNQQILKLLKELNVGSYDLIVTAVLN